MSLPAPVMEEVAKKEKIEGNRKMAIDSVVIRIMKARKKLTISELLQEVLQGLHMFKPQPKFIKECIENLIEREFLERNGLDRSTLNYLA